MEGDREIARRDWADVAATRLNWTIDVTCSQSRDRDDYVWLDCERNNSNHNKTLFLFFLFLFFYGVIRI